MHRGARRLTSPALLRALMHRSGRSLADLAKIAGVHRSFISHLVDGRSPGTTPERAELIAAALHVDTAVLFLAPGGGLPPRPDGAHRRAARLASSTDAAD